MRRVEAEEDAHGGGDAEGQEHGPGVDDGVPLAGMTHGQGAAEVFGRLGIHDHVLQQTAALPGISQRTKQLTLEVIKALRQRSGVLYTEPNYWYRALVTPDDVYYPYQWSSGLIRLPDAWDLTTGSADVIVAIVDSGVLSPHPDLSAKLTGNGYDFVNDPDSSGDGDGIDGDPDDPGDDGAGFHGTHVAGIVAARTGNGEGVAGVGWETRVMAVRALGTDGGGTSPDIAQAIRYAAGLENDAGTVPDPPADIINLSLGSPDESYEISEAIQAARSQGVIVVAAAGNEGTSQAIYPAADDNVVAVSAVDSNGTRAPYSNYGGFVDVAAPGGDATVDADGDGYGDGVLSTLGSETQRTGEIEMTYGFYEGTSMAAPHVAGVAALMRAIWPGMTPDDFDQLLAGGALTTGTDDATSYGAGLIDAHKAVQAAQANYVPAMLSVNPSQVEMGIALTTATLTVEKSGDSEEALDLVEIAGEASWLDIAADTVDTHGLGAYTASVDRTGLADGDYSGTVQFVSSQNTVRVAVDIQVSTIDTATDAGYHYIRLVGADTGAVRYETGAGIADGRYSFSLSSVAAGNYRPIAGTDLDQDGDIDDAGEITGAYPSLDSPAQLTVDGDRSGLDLITSFNLQAVASESTQSKLDRMQRR